MALNTVDSPSPSVGAALCYSSYYDSGVSGARYGGCWLATAVHPGTARSPLDALRVARGRRPAMFRPNTLCRLTHPWAAVHIVSAGYLSVVQPTPWCLDPCGTHPAAASPDRASLAISTIDKTPAPFRTAVQDGKATVVQY